MAFNNLMTHGYKNFTNVATLVNVTHDGLCFVRCLASLLRDKSSEIDKIAKITRLFLRLETVSEVSKEVKNWVAKFRINFTDYCNTTNHKHRHLKAESYVTSNVLAEYARQYDLTIIMVREASTIRNGINISDIFLNKTETLDVNRSIVIRTSGERFDYYTPLNNKLFDSFLMNAVQVYYY